MIDGNDGGLNITHDGGNSWRFVGNIPCSVNPFMQFQSEVGDFYLRMIWGFLVL
jgi:hypothetical protein